MQDNKITSTTDFSTDTDGTLVKHTQTINDVYEKLDPFGLEAEVTNLQVNITEQDNIIDRATKTKVDLQAQIDSKQATKAQIISEVPDLAAKLTSAATPVQPEPPVKLPAEQIIP